MALTIRNGVYYAQKKIPSTNKTVRKSLGTRSKREAVRLAGVLDSVSEVILKQSKGLSFIEIKERLQHAWQDTLEKHKQKVNQDGYFTDEYFKQRRDDVVLEADLDMLPDWYTGNFPNDAGTQEVIKKEYPEFIWQLLDAVKKYQDDLKEYKPTEAKPKIIKHVADKKETVALGVLYKQWMQERLKEQTWTEKTTESIQSKFKMFFEWVKPDTDAAEFGHKQANGVKGILLEKGQAVATTNKYLQVYGNFFGWCKRHGYVQANPFEGISLRETRRAQEQREAFSFEDVPIVLERAAEQSTKKNRPMQYYKWVPLIAAYSGLRLNEICQLYKDDVQEVDGALCFVINDKYEGQRLKTTAAARTIPVHQEILDAGFVEYIEGHDSERCFPELNWSRDGYGKNASRWFNERFMRVQFPDNKCVFHSFRHTVADKMMKSDVEIGIAKAVLGHADESETFGRYGKGYTVEQLKRAIDTLSYP